MAESAPSLQIPKHVEEGPHVAQQALLSRANKEISDLKTSLAGKQWFVGQQAARIKLLQQTIRRLADKQAKQSTRAAAIAAKDRELLSCIKTAEAMLKDKHPEHFECVLSRLANAILDGKLPMDSIELEYICQLALNLSQTYINQFRYTDNIMRFFSAVKKLQSGRAVLELLNARSTDNSSTSSRTIASTFTFLAGTVSMRGTKSTMLTPTLPSA